MQAEIDRSIALAQSRTWRISPWIVIAVFAALVLTPAAVQFAGKGSGASDNRVMARAPGFADLAKPGRLSRLLESYVNDHFGLRDQLVRINSLMRYHAGVSGNPQVAIGRDKWLFYTRERIIEQHVGKDVFTPAELELWVKHLEANRAWLARRGIPMVMMIAPDKNTIYPEMLPQFPRRAGTVTRVDQIAQRLKGTDIVFIDPRAAITAAKAQHPRLYFEGDTHWGHRAAFIAYDLLAQELARRFPGFKPARLDEFDAVETLVPADLLFLLGLHGDITVKGEVLKRKVQGPRTGVDVRQPVPGSGWGWPISFHRTPLAGAPRAMIFGDSFTDYILGPAFLYESVRDPVYSHHNNMTLNLPLIEEVKPNVVILVVAERYLRNLPGLPATP
jgi:hypothetical protein